MIFERWKKNENKSFKIKIILDDMNSISREGKAKTIVTIS